MPFFRDDVSFDVSATLTTPSFLHQLRSQLLERLTNEHHVSTSRSLYGSQLPLVRDRGAYSCRYFPLSSPLTEPHKSVCSCNCCVYGPSLPRPAILASTNKNIIDELMFKIEETLFILSCPSPFLRTASSAPMVTIPGPPVASSVPVA